VKIARELKELPKNGMTSSTEMGTIYFHREGENCVGTRSGFSIEGEEKK
jgi:hypothetical protein